MTYQVVTSGGALIDIDIGTALPLPYGVTGGGSLSSDTAFAPGTYTPANGLRPHNVSSAGEWTLSWEANGVVVGGGCYGAPPAPTDKTCTPATLVVTSVDAANYIHGTFEMTEPAGSSAPAVTIQMQF